MMGRSTSRSKAICAMGRLTNRMYRIPYGWMMRPSWRGRGGHHRVMAKPASTNMAPTPVIMAKNMNPTWELP